MGAINRGTTSSIILESLTETMGLRNSPWARAALALVLVVVVTMPNPVGQVQKPTGVGSVSLQQAHTRGASAVTSVTHHSTLQTSSCVYCLVANVSFPTGGPGNLAYDPSNGTMYATNWNGGGGSWMYGIKYANISGSCCGGPYLGQPGPIAFDPSNGYLYVLNESSNISVIDPGTGKLVASIPLEGSAAGWASVIFDPENGLVYVNNGGYVWAINPATETVVATIITGLTWEGAGGLSLDPWNGFLFLVGLAGNLTLINTTRESIAGVVTFGSNCSHPWSSAFDLMTGDVYVTCRDSNSVAVLNGSTSAWVRTLHVGALPQGILYDGLGHALYVGNSGSKNLTIINASSGSVVGTASLYGLGLEPDGYETTGAMALDAAGDLYMTVTNIAGVSSNDGVAIIAVPGASPFVKSFIASPSPATLGAPVTLQSTVVSGTPPYSFTYSGLPTGCVSTDSAQLVCTPTAPGLYTVTLNVTDSDGRSSFATLSLSVAMFTVSFNSSRATAHLNETVFLNATVGGDQAPYLTYVYTGLPMGCTSSNTSSLGCTPKAAGNYSVSVSVTDSYGNRLTSGLGLTVLAGPSATIAPARLSVDANETVSFQSVVTGGAAPFRFSYLPSNASANCSISAGPSLNCTPRASLVGAAFNVSVIATDEFGNTAPATSEQVRVYPALNVTLNVSSSTPLLAQTVAFTANASGGHAPYNYAYLGLPYGCYSENKTTIGCLPTQSDWYNITVVVTDVDNGTSRATVGMHVIFDFNVVIPASTPVGKQLTIMVNTNETFNGSAINKSALIHPDGGYGTFTYSYSGLPPGCSSADVAALTCTPTQAGKYSVTVSVHDQAGDHQTHTVLVNIVPASGPGGVLGSIWGSPYAVAGIVAGAIVVIAGVVLLLRKKRSKMGSAKTTTDEESKGDEEEARKEASSKEPEEQKPLEDTKGRGERSLELEKKE